MIKDFPKIGAPFVRRVYAINKDDFEKYREKYGLRNPEVYLATPERNPGFEWVFNSPDTIASEKLNGSNVAVSMVNNRLIEMQNRQNILDPLDMSNKFSPLAFEGILHASKKQRLTENGTQYGELIGPKVQGNPYGLLTHQWIPFDYVRESLFFKSFYKHKRTYENWADWFEHYLYSVFAMKNNLNPDSEDKMLAEGIVFYNPRQENEGKTCFAKLRRDMFAFFYKDIEIYGLPDEQR